MLFNKEDLARILGVAKSTIDNLIAREGLPYIKLGDNQRSSIRFRKEDVNRWLEERVRVVKPEIKEPVRRKVAEKKRAASQTA